MRNKNRQPAYTKRFELTKRFFGYLALFIAALIYTQALRNKASHLFFLFVILYPFVMLLYTFIGKRHMGVYMVSDDKNVDKFAPYTYEFRLQNHTIFGYPFVDALMLLPQGNLVRCTERVVQVSMPPLAAYHVKNTVRFRFRGTYAIGVTCFYVYDFFRIFRMRVDVDCYNTVTVLPRRLMMENVNAAAISDSATVTKKSPFAYDKLEISDIREYRRGDSLKSVHWNLSSKSDELIVRDYNTGTSNMTYLYCDLSARFPDEPPSKPPEAVIKPTHKKKNRTARQTEKAPATADKTVVEETGVAGERHSDADLRTEQTGDRDIHAVSDDDVTAKTDARVAAMEKGRALRRQARKSRTLALDLPDDAVEQDTQKPETAPKQPDTAALASDECYEDMNEFCADGVVELTLSLAMRELLSGNTVSLLWFDRRQPSGMGYEVLHGTEDLEPLIRSFATAPLCAREDTVARLVAVTGDTQNCKQLFVTSAMDEEALTDFGHISVMNEGNNFGAAEVVLYSPEERFAHPHERRAFLETCQLQLSENGLKLLIYTPHETGKEGVL